MILIWFWYLLCYWILLKQYSMQFNIIVTFEKNDFDMILIWLLIKLPHVCEFWLGDVDSSAGGRPQFLDGRFLGAADHFGAGTAEEVGDFGVAEARKGQDRCHARAGTVRPRVDHLRRLRRRQRRWWRRSNLTCRRYSRPYVRFISTCQLITSNTRVIFTQFSISNK